MTETLVGSITGVWTEIMTWITTSLASVQTVFYAEGALTFLGVLAVIGVAIGVAFLIIGVRKFLNGPHLSFQFAAGVSC